MEFGLGPGPTGSIQHMSSHYVYDVRTGSILATYHFVGTVQKADEELHRRILQQTHEASTMPLERLAVLSAHEAPSGAGPLHVDTSSKQLVRSADTAVRRVRP